MANVVVVCGGTGTGKSTAIKTLNPDETFIINCLDKPLPFKGSSNIYSSEKKNIFGTDNWKDVLDLLTKISTQKHIKHVMIDDIGFIATKEFFARANEIGYAKFTDIGVHMQSVINKCKELPKHMTVFLNFHEDDDITDKIKVGKKVKLIGSLLEDKYNPLAIVTVCLFTDVTYDKDGKASYSFLTQRTKIAGQVIPAKSPNGMFEELRIPNDLNLVVQKLTEYYN